MRIRHALAVLSAVGLAAGCGEDVVAPEPAGLAFSDHASNASPPAPPGLTPITFGATTIHVWPFTGSDLAGTPADPLNLVFTGRADVLSLRAALVELDGDRTAFGFPNAFPFNCTWTDANGGIQTAYTSGGGWVANPVQLECGSYDGIRFHVRLFPAGMQVVGGAHFEVLIPGTPQHQVISWELARQLVVVDFLRSGRLDPATPVSVTPVIYPAPSYREIPAVIYDGLPAALKAAIGGPPSSGGVNVPIASSGRATVLQVANPAAVVDDHTARDLMVSFAQVIPRPFCVAGPTDFVRIDGDVRITTRVRIDSGHLSSHNTLQADVRVTPFDVISGTPAGEPFDARIDFRYLTGIGPNGASVNAVEHILAIPPADDGKGSLRVHITTGPNGAAHYSRRERC